MSKNVHGKMESSEPPPVNPIPPSPPPPPDLLTTISTPPGPDLPQPAPTQPETSPMPPVKSFKDTLVDGSASIEPPLITYDELVVANLNFESSIPMAEDGTNSPKLKIPKVRIPKSIWQRLCAPWKNAVIIKLLGKSVNFHVLHSRLLKEWRTENEFEVIDVGLGYYIVKFSSLQDCSRVLTGGPYKLFDHYLAVQPWEPGFHPARAKAPKTAVWIKLHGVPIVCYHEAICLYLGSKIGKPIKVDPATLLATRGKFARVCVEVDLSQPLPSSVDLDLEELPQSLIPIEFEGLHKICFHCGEFGHIEEYCRFKNPGKAPPPSNPSSKAMVELTQTLKPNTEDNDMTFGPWMVQQRKPRRQQQLRRPVEQSAGTFPTPPKIQDHHNSTTIIATSGSHESMRNRFEVMAAITEEDTALLNGNMVIEPPLAGISSPIKDPTSHSMPMDIIPTNLPPAPSTAFVKPKPKKKKIKIGGPVLKDPKPVLHKPYQPPPGITKQKEYSLVLPTVAETQNCMAATSSSTSTVAEANPRHNQSTLLAASEQNPAQALASNDSAIMIVTWNSRGVRHAPFRRECKELIKMQKPEIICFLETKAKVDSPDLRFMLRFGYDQQYRVHSLGRAGGLWLFWKSSLVDLEVLSSTNQAIHCLVRQQRLLFLTTFVYVQPHTAMKNEFWSFLHDLALSITGSWVVMGDFNDIATVDEASPRAMNRFTSARRFRDHLDTCTLLSKDSLGCKFTWIRKANGRTILRERLDRALFNMAGLEEFPDAKLINLPRLCSDHHPIMLNIDPPIQISGAAKPPRFEAACTISLFYLEQNSVWRFVSTQKTP
ncbi:hypothetical protein SLEP1_g6995 [Rubroshorea leprosula]|uniref:CCHC-type domain-containing protein n=1 Tax=Rubroshorea leprosula TaxID=152421 RepID=A0AAV5I1K5_9ROSI|nr:hypothetical protein SLEP1_g6995 [Rubroshorea leprosula]